MAEPLDTELADLPQPLRWREWMARVEAVLFAASEPVGRDVLLRVVGGDCALDLLIEAEHGPDSSAWLVTSSRRVAEEALAAIKSLSPVNIVADNDRRALLKARILDFLGRKDEAASLYEDVIDRYAGIEARCRYAAMLIDQGEDL